MVQLFSEMTLVIIGVKGFVFSSIGQGVMMALEGLAWCHFVESCPGIVGSMIDTLYLTLSNSSQ